MGSSVVAGLLMTGESKGSPRTPAVPSSAFELRSSSTEDSFTMDKARLRVSYGGHIVQDKAGAWKYQGGDTYLESVPAMAKYSDFIFRLVEKTGCAVAVKYLLPGEDLDPDALITVSDDSDLQEMREEYLRGLRIPGTPIKTFRLRVLLFPASEEPFTPEELADGEQFFSHVIGADRLGKSGGGGGSSVGRASTARTPPDAGRSTYSSALSNGTASQTDSATDVNGGGAEVDAWQAGFEAGQEAAAWARLPSGSFDAEESSVKSPAKSRTSLDTPRGAQFGKAPPLPNVVALTAQSVLSDDDGGFPSFWQGVNSGLPGSARAGAQLLPSRISVFDSGRSGASAGPQPPAVPQVADLVSAGVRLPSHISAFGDNSLDERLEDGEQWLPQAVTLEPQHPGGLDAGGLDAMLPALPMLPTLPVRCMAPEMACDDQAAGMCRRPSVTVTSPSALRFPKVHCVPQDEVTVQGRIGEGAFGEVSLATSPIFGQVAVKWLKPAKHLQRSSETFWGEAEVLASVNHPNVLRFYGVVTQSAGDPTCVGIMTEYMCGGSLADMIRHRDAYLPLRQRAEIALSAVKGLAYLHEMRIVHFDLKPDNLLLDGFGGGVTVKVADFGLHKHKKENASFVSGVHDLRGTLPYVAPELVSDPLRVSEKADVWSLGMVLWEMLTLQVPFNNLSPQQIVAGLMVGNLQPPIPAWAEPAWVALMESCWEVSPTARPAMRDVAQQLEAILQTH